MPVQGTGIIASSPQAAGVPTQAFKVQRGTSVIAGSSGSVTITAGTEYTAPASNTAAFIRIANMKHTGMGNTSGGAKRDLDEHGVWVSNPNNLVTSVTFNRSDSATTQDCRVSWEIVEYVGAGGGANEMIVRDAANLTGTSQSLTGSAITPSDANDVVIFVTGQQVGRNDDDQASSMLRTADLDGSDQPVLTKGHATAHQTQNVSYAAVEFTGSNWSVAREEFSTTGTAWATSNDNEFTVNFTTALADTAKAFLEVQYRHNTVTNCTLAQQWDAVGINSTTAMRLSNRNISGTRTKVVWVVENSQADGTARNLSVQHFHVRDDTTSGSEERVFTQSVTAVDDTEQTSVMGANASMDGTATGNIFSNRGAIDFRLTADDTVTFTESDNGQERRYNFSVVEWPEDPS